MKFKFKARTDNWEGFFSYNHTDQARSVKAYIVQTPLFKGGEVSFDYLPWQRGDLKNFKKGVEEWCRGRSFLKGGGAETFLVSFFQGLSFLHLEITLCKIVLCIWRKKIFFGHHNFMKKGHSKSSKNKPKRIPSDKLR